MTETILVTGGTGLVGRALVPELVGRGAQVRLVSRSAGPPRGRVERVQWNGVDPGADAFRDLSAVVHLAGEPVFGGLPSKQRQRRIRDSRVDSTRAIVDRIEAQPADARPRSFVCASAVGYYGDRGEEVLAEGSAPGDGFLADVCREWEAEAARAESLGVRVVRLRIGVVLSDQGGALSLMKIPFSLGLGGRLGHGRQFFPWIHRDDLVATILWALDADYAGAVNAVAPDLVRNIELTRALGRVLSRPTILPVPAFAVRLGLGVFAGELLGSRRVRPGVLLDHDFKFRHGTLESALERELG